MLTAHFDLSNLVKDECDQMDEQPPLCERDNPR